MLVTLLSTLAYADESLRVELRKPAEGCQGVIQIERLCGGTKTHDDVAISGSSVTISDDPTCERRVALLSPTCWAAPVHIGPGDSRLVTIAAWPAAHIHGTLSVSSHERTPKRIQGDVLSIDGASISDGGLDCHTANSEWRCAVPAGNLSLRIGADGFAPHYIFEALTSPKHELDVGSVPLRRGASISGWVMTSNKAADLSNIRVTLTISGRTSGRAATPALTALTTPRGFFQLAGVPLGTYEVTAERPGWSAGRQGRIVVREAAETQLAKPLMMNPLATLQAIIDPAIPAQDKQWRVVLERINPANRSEVFWAAESTVSPAGTFDKGGLELGAYRLSVIDPAGSVLTREVIDVADQTNVRTISIDRIAIRGRVALGREPLEATLVFAWRDGSSVRLQSDSDGNFSGSLSHQGKWQVRVSPKDGHPEIRSQAVVIRRPAASDHVRVDINLPEGRLHGTVVDETGQPARASVLLFRQNWLEETIASAADGTFDFVGVDAGPVLLAAQTRDAETGLIAAEVIAGDRGDVRLILKARTEIHGRVVTPDGAPIAGVLLRYTSPLMMSTKETVSGPNGDFLFSVPSGSASATVAAVTAAFPAKLQSIHDLANDVSLTLGRISGTLVVSLGGVPPWPAISNDGAGYIGLRFLMAPPTGDKPFENATPDGFEFQVEPGSYVICPDSQASTRCVTQTVQTGARVVVDARNLWTEEQREQIRKRLP